MALCPRALGTPAHPYAVTAGPFQAVEAGGGGEFSQAGGICIAGSPACLPETLARIVPTGGGGARARDAQGAGGRARQRGRGAQSREAAGRGPDGGREISG